MKVSRRDQSEATTHERPSGAVTTFTGSDATSRLAETRTIWPWTSSRSSALPAWSTARRFWLPAMSATSQQRRAEVMLGHDPPGSGFDDRETSALAVGHVQPAPIIQTAIASGFRTRDAPGSEGAGPAAWAKPAAAISRVAETSRWRQEGNDPRTEELASCMGVARLFGRALAPQLRGGGCSARSHAP